MNPNLKSLIIELKKLSNKEKVNVWKKVASDLEKSNRRLSEVNLYKVEQYLRDGEVAVVAGKVLSNGSFSKSNTVAAWRFSAKAKEEINKKGKAISIAQLIKENPKGKKVRILG